MNVHPVTTAGAATTITFATIRLAGTTTATTHINELKNVYNQD
jgi:hypothetical protein